MGLAKKTHEEDAECLGRDVISQKIVRAPQKRKHHA